MQVVLAEKPSVAREIASVLRADGRREGYFEGHGCQVTWAYGHLVTLKEPGEYDPALKKWSLDPLPFIPSQFELKLVDDKLSRQQFDVIKRLLQAASEIVCATDAGREGELIFRYILSHAGCSRKPFRRLWLSSLTRRAIEDAWQHLQPGSVYDHLYAAARCRSEADWIVGLNGTRNYTVRYGAGGMLWSVGRVQTPVLAMIARRDDEIRTFRPEPFWELLTRYRDTTFKFDGERFRDEQDALRLLERVRGQPFHITEVERKTERSQPPQLYDLTELQRDMNRRYGLSADATLKAAQSLYEGKLITYPRTDSRYLSSDMQREVPEILTALQSYRPDAIGPLDLGGLRFSGRIVNDSKVTDHHAIIPTGNLPGTLAAAEQKVFDAVVTRLIAVFYPPCEKEVTTVHGVSNTVPFRAHGYRVLAPGWTVLYPRRKDDAAEDDGSQELPAFVPGEEGPHAPEVRRGETTPPKPYTENTLLGAMETAGKLVDDEQLRELLKEKGLGTPATRAAIIETLLQRGYVRREKKTLTATDLGRYLVAVVQDAELKSLELTGQWEGRLREIEAGRLDPQQFMAEIAAYARRIVSTDAAASPDPNRWGDCPRCGRPVIQGKRGFGCSGWREGCAFVLWPEYKSVHFGPDEIRRLLQRRVLLPPVRLADAGEVVLRLTDSGHVTEIPVPAAAERGGRRAARRGSSRRGAVVPTHSADGKGRPRPARRSASDRIPADRTMADRSPPARGRKGGRRRAAAAPVDDQSPAAAGQETAELGACPLCGSPVVELPKLFRCSAPGKTCPLAIWKTIAGKRITAATARALLQHGETPELGGFRSKAGRPFSARLRLVNGEVKFAFAD